MEYKICPGCKKELPRTTEFFATRTDKGYLQWQSKCRSCQKEYRKGHYNNNKQKYIDKAAAFTKSMVDWFIDIRKTFVCSECGETRHWVLDFHHLDPNEKDDNIVNLVRKGNKEKAIKEMEKCIILCANCHRDFHYHERYAGDA